MTNNLNKYINNL